VGVRFLLGNFWYHSPLSSLELLIEALIGRTNAEVKQIKNCFRDQKYNDDLIRCMEGELKADKFQEAILIVLTAKRQEETDPILMQYVNRDMAFLRQAIETNHGGERTVLQIVFSRSDVHLRQVLKSYESVYGTNFARDALRRSNNLMVSSVRRFFSLTIMLTTSTG